MTSYISSQKWPVINLLGVIILVFSSYDTSFANERKGPIHPPLLHRGDKVAIVAPAFWLIDAKLIVSKATKLLNSWGLEVVLGQHLYKKSGRLAGTDAQRREDLQGALDDPTIKAVFTLRAGYGTTRIVDELDFTQFLRGPKWIIGFSDMTNLLTKSHQLDVASIHGEMLKNFSEPRYASSITSLKKLLFEGTAQLKAPASKLNRLGVVTAPVVGGNLSLLCSNLGTPLALDARDKILVIEDINMVLFRLDRMLMQLKRAGVLEHLAGLVIGSATAIGTWNKNVEEIIKEHVADYNYPVAFRFPIGHEAPNLAFPHGGVGKLCVEKEKASLIFAPQGR
ncbi:MAG: LD-carboxypeptidase [Bacteroidota bacterium]